MPRPARTATLLLGTALTLAACSSSGSAHRQPSTPAQQTCPSTKAVANAIDDPVGTVKRTQTSATTVACGYNLNKTIVIGSVTFGIKHGDLAGIAVGLGRSRTVRPLAGIGDEAAEILPTSTDTRIIVVRYGSRAVTVDMDETHDNLNAEKAFVKLFA